MLTTADVAAIAGASQDTVLRAIHGGDLEAHRAGGDWYIPAGAGHAWAEQYEPYAALRKPATTGGEEPGPDAN